MKKFKNFLGEIAYIDKTTFRGIGFATWMVDQLGVPYRLVRNALPVRDTFEEALTDLQIYARQQGWTPVE